MSLMDAESHPTSSYNSFLVEILLYLSLEIRSMILLITNPPTLKSLWNICGEVYWVTHPLSPSHPKHFSYPAWLESALCSLYIIAHFSSHPRVGPDLFGLPFCTSPHRDQHDRSLLLPFVCIWNYFFLLFMRCNNKYIWMQYDIIFVVPFPKNPKVQNNPEILVIKPELVAASTWWSSPLALFGTLPWRCPHLKFF